MSEMDEVENVIMIGSGPAGYTAALYTARANLLPLVIEGFAWGGLLQQTTDVENYPGFPEGVMGPEMMSKFRDQAERFGARLVTDQADRVELAREPGGIPAGESRARRVAEAACLGRARRYAGPARFGVGVTGPITIGIPHAKKDFSSLLDFGCYLLPAWRQVDLASLRHDRRVLVEGNIRLL